MRNIIPKFFLKFKYHTKLRSWVTYRQYFTSVDSIFNFINRIRRSEFFDYVDSIIITPVN